MESYLGSFQTLLQNSEFQNSDSEEAHFRIG